MPKQKVNLFDPRRACVLSQCKRKDSSSHPQRGTSCGNNVAERLRYAPWPVPAGGCRGAAGLPALVMRGSENVGAMTRGTRASVHVDEPPQYLGWALARQLPPCLQCVG